MSETPEPEVAKSVDSGRLQALESQVRRLRSVVMIMACVFAVCGGLALLVTLGVLKMPRLRVDRIEAAKFVLWDQRGRERGRFEVQNEDKAQLVIYRLRSDSTSWEEDPHHASPGKAVALEAWGERGIIFVRERAAYATLSGNELMLTPGPDRSPALMLGYTWDRRPRLSVQDTSESTYMHFPPLGLPASASSPWGKQP